MCTDRCRHLKMGKPALYLIWEISHTRLLPQSILEVSVYLSWTLQFFCFFYIIENLLRKCGISRFGFILATAGRGILLGITKFFLITIISKRMIHIAIANGKLKLQFWDELENYRPSPSKVGMIEHGCVHLIIPL